MNNKFHILFLIQNTLPVLLLKTTIILCTLKSSADQPPSLDSATVLVGSYTRSPTLGTHCTRTHNRGLQLLLPLRNLHVLLFFIKPNGLWRYYFLYYFFYLVLILKLSHSCPSYDLPCKSVLLSVTKPVNNGIFFCSEIFDHLPFHQSLPYQSLHITK